MEIFIVHRRCDNCRYFDDSITDEDGLRSPCRALPPTVPIGARSPAGEWPFVEESDWCGNHVIDQNKCDANEAAEIAEQGAN
jgi:hypothetical protein